MTEALSARPPASVEVRDLRHTYESRGGRTQVLGGLDLVVRPGEFVALVGPSGCGKSTLLRVLAGLLVPSGGDARIDDVSVLGAPGHAAFMPQRDLLLPWRRVLANATLAAEVRGVSREDARERARAELVRFGLDGFERAWPSQLSGGMRQRLALLRTFLAGQSLLLLDEPFGALDAITRRGMHAWLQEVWGADPRTVIFVTHDVEEAVMLADRVVVLSGRPGRVVDVASNDHPRPRRSDVVGEHWFVELRARLLHALEHGE